MSGTEELPPLHAITSDDNGAYCLIYACSWACIVGIVAVGRFLLALNRKLKIELDDASFALATALAITSSAFYALAVNAGLGRHMSMLDATQVTQYFKMMYGAQLAGIAAIGMSKLSVLFLQQRSALLGGRPAYILFALVVAWTILSVFIDAFQCQLPEPWRFTPSNCPSRGRLQYLITVLNMITDVTISIWPIRPVMKLNMPKEERIVVVVLFSTRNIIPCLAIGQLVFLARSLPSTDQTWENAFRMFFDLAIVHLSVIFATLPRVNRALYSMRADLVIGRISHFELGEYDSDAHSQEQGVPDRSPRRHSVHSAEKPAIPARQAEESLGWTEDSGGSLNCSSLTSYDVGGKSASCQLEDLHISSVPP